MNGPEFDPAESAARWLRSCVPHIPSKADQRREWTGQKTRPAPKTPAGRSFGKRSLAPA